jgi:hypothetical protein
MLSLVRNLGCDNPFGYVSFVVLLGSLQLVLLGRTAKAARLAATDSKPRKTAGHF